MKTLKFKTLAAFLLLSLCSLISFSGEIEDFSKKYRHEFKVKEDTRFVLKNKYGKVNINEWDQPLILVEVTIRVDAGNKEKADRILDKIDIRFEEDGNEVRALTEMGSFNFKGDFSIDYEVKMPSTVQMDLSNKFGDMFIDRCRSRSKISVEYGGLKANRLLFPTSDPLSLVSVSFGSATIEEFSFAKLQIKYSKLNLTSSNVAYLVTEFSHMALSDNNSCIIDSRYDTYRIEKTNNLVFKGRFSELTTQKLTRKADIDTEYGNVDLGEVAGDFESLKIESRFANVSADMAPDASYRVEGKARFGEIELPSGNQNLFKKDDFSMKVSGKVGSQASPAGTVTIDTEYGNVDLD